MSQLQTNEAVLAKLVLDGPIAIVVSTLADGQILDVNESFLHLFGYTRDDVIGKTSADLGMWADPTQRAELTGALVTGRPLCDFEAAVHIKSGAERRVLATVSQVEIDGSTCLLTQLYDITAYRQIGTRYRALVEQLPVITYGHDPDEWQTLTYVSPQVETMLGYTPDEVLGGQPDFLTSRTHPEDREALREAVDRAAATGTPLCVEYRVQARDGRWVWLRDEAVLVRDAQDVPLLWQGVIADITERKQAEAAHLEAEARYSALFQHSLDAVLLTAPDGRILDANPEACRIFGRTTEELRQIGREGIVDLADPRLGAALAERARTGQFRGGLTLRRSDCETFPAEVVTQVFSGSGGQTCTSMTIRDLTDQRQAEAALRESEERFRAVWEATSEAVALSDPDGIVLAVNPAYCALYGLSAEEVVGHSFAVIFPEETREWAEEQYRAIFADPDPPQSYKTRVQRPDGSERVVEARADFIVRGGRRVALVSAIRDVTERHAAQAALRESEDRFRRAFDHAPIGMSLVAQDGRYMQVNRALCELVGYSEEELLGTSFQAITHPDDLADNLDLFRRLWAGEIDTYQLEKRYLHKDGHVVWIQLTGSIVRDADGPKYGIAQILDITNRRRVEMDRAIMLASEREYTRQLQALTEMRADLTAMIAHELRAPVAALRMMTFLLATGELSSQAEGEMFAAVKDEIEQLDRLINDVADVTAAEREDFSVQLNSVPLRVMFENATTFARAKLGNHPFTVPPAPEVNVWCDAERISQVLRNLLDNAARHTPPGTPVELRAHRDGARVHIEVADRGPGMPAEDVALIFEKFGRGRQAGARQTPGAGLGLYLSRRIMLAHGSDLTVESAPGKGTIFAFALEVAP